MRIATTSKSLSSAITMLAEELNPIGPGADIAWLTMVERESAFIIALARLEAEDRKEKRGASEKGAEEEEEEE